MPIEPNESGPNSMDLPPYQNKPNLVGGAIRVVFWILCAVAVFEFGPLIIQINTGIIAAVWRDTTEAYEQRFTDPVPAELSAEQGFTGPYAVVGIYKNVKEPVQIVAINHEYRQIKGYWLDNGVKAGEQFNVGGGEGWTWREGEKLLVSGGSEYRSLVWTFDGTNWNREVLLSADSEELLKKISTYTKSAIQWNEGN